MKFENINKEMYPQVGEIYREGIASGHATFETNVPDWLQWNQEHVNHSRIGAIENDQILGWAALSPVSGRCVYGGVAEVSVYVKSSEQGKGIGTILLSKLINESEQNGIWSLQAGIFPENIGSMIIHEKCGFRIVGVREKLGQMNGIWRDVCLLERRSRKIGYQQEENHEKI